MAGPRNTFAPAFLVYSLLRLAVFVVPLVVIYALSRNPVLSAVIAAVIGFALSMILLVRQRTSVAQQLQDRSDTRRVLTDEAIEDEAVETASDQNDSAAANPRP